MLAPQDTVPSVRSEHLAAGYQANRPVIRNLDLSVTGPGIVRVDGPNGAGKSTLVEVMSGYLRPLSGTMEICDRPASLPETRAYRLVCRTTPALHPSLNVHDHIVIAARAHGRPLEELMGRAGLFGLAEYLEEPVHSLSSGTAKKLWYVLTTASDRLVTILDEPFNAIDAETVERMVHEINRWSEDRLVMLVSHLPPRGLSIDRTICLDGHASA